MQLLVQLADASTFAFLLLLFAVQVVAREAGLWIGRHHREHGTGERDIVNVLVGSMLALLAFVLALTLAFATSRFQERRSETLQEATTIGSAWTRAHAVGGPQGLEIAHLLVEYAEVRKAFVEAPPDAVRLAEINRHSDRLQAEMLEHLSALVRERPDPASVSLMSSLDETFGAAARTQFAFGTQMPAQLFWLLIAMSLSSMAALGFQIGFRGQTLRVLSLLLTAMWTVVIADILDLSSARVGNLHHDTAVYDWTLQALAGGPPAPVRAPAPTP